MFLLVHVTVRHKKLFGASEGCKNKPSGVIIKIVDYSSHNKLILINNAYFPLVNR